MRKNIKLYSIFLFTAAFFIFTCTDNEEFWVLDNPLDPQGTNWFPPSVTAMQDTTIAVYDSFYVHAAGSDSNGLVYYYVWAIEDTLYQDTVTSNTFKTAFSTAGVKQVKVKVIDDDGLVSPPDSVDITVKLNTPINLSPANGSVGQPLLSEFRWIPGFYSTSFTVLLDTLNPPVLAAATGITDTFYTVTASLKYNTTYYWRIAGFDSTGNSDTSSAWSFSTLIEITGLVLYYPFNGNADDSSGNGNNGTVNGSALTTDKDGNANKAYSFNGTSDYIQIPFSPELAWNDTKDFSVFTWINPANVTGGTMVIACDPAQYNGKFEWRLWVQDKCLRPEIDNSGMQGWSFFSDSVITTGEWYFVGYTYNGSTKEVRVYINGVFDTSNVSVISGTATQTGFNMFLLGAAWNGTGISAHYAGKIDEVRIYNRKLSEMEIHYLYNSYNNGNGEKK